MAAVVYYTQLSSFDTHGRSAGNAGGGTDHGTAGPVFLIGPAARTGVHEAHPDLGDLVDGGPRFRVVFRRVYATVPER